MLTARLHIVTRCLDGLSRARLAPIYVSIPSFRPLKSIIGGPGLRVVLGYLHAVPAKCSPSQHRRPRNEVLALSCEDVQRPPRILEKGGTYAWWGWGGHNPEGRADPRVGISPDATCSRCSPGPATGRSTAFLTSAAGASRNKTFLGKRTERPTSGSCPPTRGGPSERRQVGR